MKDLCVDARMLLSSGIGTYLRNLLQRMQGGSFHLKLIVHPDAPQKLPWIKDFELIFCDAPIYSISEQLQLPRIVPASDLFWSPHFNIPLLPIRARQKIVTVHDAYHLAFFNHLKLAEKCYTKMVFSRLKRYADRIITVSQFSKMELSKRAGLPVEKVISISNGLDQELFSSKSPDKFEALKKRHALPEKYILFVGNLKPHKNVQGLIQAFRCLQETALSEYGLVLVGKRANFRTVEQSLPVGERAVCILEDVSDEELPALYQHAQLFVLPSFYEGFGLTPLEAMSAGCPVIVSRAASLPEVCGEAAEYVEPHDVADIARGITKVLSAHAVQEELKCKGRERAAQFSWQKSAEKHMQIFEEVIK